MAGQPALAGELCVSPRLLLKEFLTERTNELLAQLVELQGRQIAVLEAQLENQQIALERQRSALRRSFPLVIGLVVLIAYGPYLFQWARYLLQR